MKFHAGLFISTIVFLSVFSACFAHENPGATEAAIDSPEIQKPADAPATGNSPEIQKPAEAESANDNPEIEKPAEATTAGDSPRIQKPSEAEAMEAALRYVNPDGKLTIKKSELLGWGTFSEKQVYWPMKFRVTYIAEGADKPRQNEYAVKVSKDSNGKWVATQYWAWRTETWRADIQ